MSNNSIDENIIEYNRIQKQIQLEKVKKRKARTRRLIQKGALLEKYFNIQKLTPDETESFLKELKKKTT